MILFDYLLIFFLLDLDKCCWYSLSSKIFYTFILSQLSLCLPVSLSLSVSVSVFPSLSLFLPLPILTFLSGYLIEFQTNLVWTLPLGCIPSPHGSFLCDLHLLSSLALVSEITSSYWLCHFQDYYGFLEVKILQIAISKKTLMYISRDGLSAAAKVSLLRATATDSS